MCPEDTDATASEMLDVTNLLYTAQWVEVPVYLTCKCLQLSTPLTHALIFGQNNMNANPSLYAQLHTKAITVSMICECLSSGIGGFWIGQYIFPYMFHWMEK